MTPEQATAKLTELLGDGRLGTGTAAFQTRYMNGDEAAKAEIAALHATIAGAVAQPPAYYNIDPRTVNQRRRRGKYRPLPFLAALKMLSAANGRLRPVAPGFFVLREGSLGEMKKLCRHYCQVYMEDAKDLLQCNDRECRLHPTLCQFL
jgi:hypothetical protein